MSCILRAPSSSSRDDPPEMLTPSTFQGTHRVLPQFHHGWQDGRDSSTSPSSSSAAGRPHAATAARAGAGMAAGGVSEATGARTTRGVSGRWGATTTGARGARASG
jgi:transcription elongation factor